MPPDQRPEAGVNPEESVPEEIVNAAREAFARRSAGDLAVLVYDSLVDAKEPADDHHLRFEHERFRFDLNVSVRPTEVDLAGTVSPAAGGRYELVIDQGNLGFVFDSADGSFAFGPVGHGLVRLTFEPPQGPKIHTDWFRI